MIKRIGVNELRKLVKEDVVDDKAFNSGYEAGKREMTDAEPSDNPHDYHTDEWFSWQKGYKKAMSDLMP